MTMLATPPSRTVDRRALLAMLRRGSTPPAAAPVAPAAAPPAPVRPDRVPMTAIQRAMAVAEGLGPLPSHTCPLALRLTGRLHVPALRWALTRLAARHDVLRARATWQDGGMLSISPEPRAEPLVTRVPGDGTPDEQRAARFARQAALVPLAVQGGPLWHAQLGVLGERDHVLVLVLHHLTCDGWSMGVLLEELAALYTAAVTGTPDELPEPGQFTVLAADQAAGTGRVALQARFDRAVAELAGVQRLVLPPGRDLATPGQRAVVFSTGLSADERRAIGRLVQLRATPFAGVFACLQLLLSRWSGQRTFPLATVVSGRERAERARVVGPLINVVPVRCDIDPAEPFAEHLARVGRRLAAAQDMAAVPYPEVVQRLAGPVGEPGARYTSVLSQALPAVAAGHRLRLPDLAVSLLPVPEGAAKFGLTVDLAGPDSDPRLLVKYDPAAHDQSQAQQLGTHLRALVQAASAAPGRRLADLLTDLPPGRLSPTSPPAGHPPAAVAAAPPTEANTAGRPASRPAGTEPERELVACWAEVLRLAPHQLDATSDFFAQGGHSLAAVRLLHLIQERLGAAASLADLLAARTPAALARLLAHGGSGPTSHRVTELAAGGPATVVLVHPLGGGLDCYRSLAGALGPEYRGPRPAGTGRTRRRVPVAGDHRSTRDGPGPAIGRATRPMPAGASRLVGRRRIRAGHRRGASNHGRPGGGGGVAGLRDTRTGGAPAAGKLRGPAAGAGHAGPRRPARAGDDDAGAVPAHLRGSRRSAGRAAGGRAGGAAGHLAADDLRVLRVRRCPAVAGGDPGPDRGQRRPAHRRLAGAAAGATGLRAGRGRPFLPTGTPRRGRGRRAPYRRRAGGHRRPPP